MENIIFVKRYDADELPVDLREAWRYSGYHGKTNEIDDELNKTMLGVVEDLKDAFSFKVCYRRMQLLWKGDIPCLPFKTDSKALIKCLEGCKEIILFGATIGLDIDRYIARNQKLSQVKALCAQGYGAERIETLCDRFCRDIFDEVNKEGYTVSRRFSPGYGGFSLDAQTEIFNLLDCSRKIGLSLNRSLIMSPSKSVTALFGIKEGEKMPQHKCSDCGSINCSYRTK